ncbi:G2 and S phase-expressed protein 1 [Hyla sarda]|uniref:G2 and S phase-expressed protein 1 n=1 Tax=Hyla sarda TaxID=327740 RepID=UPI0024C31A8B|nr:G2 and S phase-expressed protein 1 [Hyla sarda]XP_056429659.1 G2 and S phase-expressed protein 1 [Hyla sarda]XP_056429660.1 G2 and S phase-expressed protein 1 [Hyla sarda]XP_056429661.1 G2 and S phase-expressed protein 1 [Hyla sarda]
MDAGGDFTLLVDEKFDFDISLSPTSAKEDNVDCDDEVFVGPVGHKEKCVSAALKSQSSEEKLSPLTTEQAVWSPLSGDKFVEIFKEAHLLALQLECFANEDQKKAEPATPVPNPAVEKFVQESKSKLNLFDAFNEVNKTPVAIKRETYCIQDSPFHQLPPSVQQRLTVSNGKAEISCGIKSQNCSNPLKVPKLVKSHSSSPLAQKIKAPKVKSAAPLANNVKTVSKLQPMKAPAVHTKNNHLAVEKPKAIKKTSPARRKNLNSMGSTEDLLSDKSSIASDISDSSFNTSIVGPSKRTLPVPNKLGLNKVQFKTPSASTGFRRNTSSSSSSHSSMNASLNSSLSFSPPASIAKQNASLSATLNTSVTSSRLKPSTNRLALVRPVSGVASSLKNTTNLPNGHPKQSTATKPTVNASSSVSVSQSQPPSGKMLRQTSAPNLQRLPPPSKMENAVKGTNAKPQAKVLPTPTSRLKLPQKQAGPSPDRAIGKNFPPKRLLSCGEIGSGIAQSTPLGGTKGMTTNSNIAPRSVSATPNSKHVSALPTPISRRASGLVTPRTIPRLVSSLRQAATVQAFTETVKSPVGSAECDQKRTKTANSQCSPIEDPPASNKICCSLNFSPENKPVLTAENEEWSVPEKQSEVLLIDIEVDKTNKVRKPSSIDIDSQPLIDLSNTPEFTQRLIPLKSANIGQLIDLSSPLMKLSPSGNKENLEYDSPLLKF